MRASSRLVGDNPFQVMYRGVENIGPSCSHEVTLHLTWAALHGSPRLMYKRKFSRLTQTLSNFGFSEQPHPQVIGAVTSDHM